jgi:hypothetical protein
MTPHEIDESRRIDSPAGKEVKSTAQFEGGDKLLKCVVRKETVERLLCHEHFSLLDLSNA